jgi:hypothetical protein
MCFELETECPSLSSSDGWADVSLPVATVAPSNNEQMMSARPSLLGATVAVDVSTPIATRGHSYNRRFLLIAIVPQL